MHLFLEIIKNIHTLTAKGMKVFGNGHTCGGGGGVHVHAHNVYMCIVAAGSVCD